MVAIWLSRGLMDDTNAKVAKTHDARYRYFGVGRGSECRLLIVRVSGTILN